MNIAEIQNLFCKGGSPADLWYEKEQKGRCGEMDNKITHNKYSLDWSQYKVYLVYLLIQSGDIYMAAILPCKQIAI